MDSLDRQIFLRQSWPGRLHRSLDFAEPCSGFEPELFEDVLVTEDDLGMIDIPGSAPNHDGEWTDIVLDVSLLVFELGGFFGDGFETGDTSAWSLVEP